ncbi:unnamed protein product, partial [Amoebophrya sp. A120]
SGKKGACVNPVKTSSCSTPAPPSSHGTILKPAGTSVQLVRERQHDILPADMSRSGGSCSN